MELDAPKRPFDMAKAHDHALFGPCRDAQLFRQRRSLRHERVVAAGLKWRRETFEEISSLVPHRGGLAVKDFRGPDNTASESTRDRLMSEAHAESRNTCRKVSDRADGDTRILGSPGSG